MKKILLITLSSLFLAACFPKTNQQSWNTQRYSFENTHPVSNASSHSSGNIISISPASINVAFASKSFVYQKSPYEYLHDPYRQFTAPPNILITHFIQTDLAQQSTATIIDPDSLLSPNYVLQLSIEAFYADYQDKAAPKAVTNIRATLFQVKKGETTQISNELFTQRLGIKPNDPNDLMRAYAENLSQIDKKLATFIDLANKKEVSQRVSSS